MLIERMSTLKLDEVEPNLRAAAQRMGASVTRQEIFGGAALFTIEHPSLYETLLAADIRFFAFLPCRIAVIAYHGGLKLMSLSPIQFAADCPPEVTTAAAALENVIFEILVDLERFPSTEEQMDTANTVPQRTDSIGSKIEDLAGTGSQDSPGG